MLSGGRLVDGTGAGARLADVLVSGGRVTAIEPPGPPRPGWTTLPVAGLVVAPGFIDVHSHADASPFLAADDVSKLSQGVTTEVVGNCGFSLAPRAPGGGSWERQFQARLFPETRWSGHSFEALQGAADRRGYVTNMAPLVGHGALRAAVLGEHDRAPSPAELRAMRQLLAESLTAGAFGLSSGLIYPPSMFGAPDELQALCAVLPPRAVYATHMRDEGRGVLDAIREALAVARAAGCELEISHHKVSGRHNWGRSRETLAELARGRDEGVRVDQDAYPYCASSTMLSVLLPPEWMRGDEGAIRARLRDPVAVAELETHIGDDRDRWESHVRACGWDGIRIAATPSHGWEGRSLAEVAAELAVSPTAALAQVLAEEGLRVQAILWSMDEDDVLRVLADRHTMIGSDGLPVGFGGRPHPRLWGTFPRVLSHYVRERRLLSMEAAVHKMTGLPARKFGLTGRGVVAVGAVADLTVFAPDTVRDRADFDDGTRPPEGIRWVLLAGAVALRDGVPVPGRMGQRLRPDWAGAGPVPAQDAAGP